MRQLLVSIIINNYNYGHFLQQAVESALKQTYPNTEVIVVDDGSTDNSREIIACYQDRIISVLKDNAGQGSAYNAGFAVSQGDIVIFLDSDDILLPNTLEEVVKVWHPGVAKVQYRLELIDADGQRQSTKVPTSMHSGNLVNLIFLFGAYASSPGSGNAYGRDALTQILPMPENDWRWLADTFTTLLSPFFGVVISCPDVLGYYRLHDSNSLVTTSSSSSLKRDLKLDKRSHLLVLNFAKKMGFKIPEKPHIGAPYHFKRRLSLLRLYSSERVDANDTSWSLAKQGINAIWQWPGFSFLERVQFSVWFVLVAALPMFVVKQLINWALMPQTRPILRRS